MNKCLFPSCKKPSKNRGLCQNHYQSALRLVNKNLTTWKTLVADGKALDVSKSFRRSHVSDWFLLSIKKDTPELVKCVEVEK